jgi:hypothetical protein
MQYLPLPPPPPPSPFFHHQGEEGRQGQKWPWSFCTEWHTLNTYCQGIGGKNEPHPSPEMREMSIGDRDRNASFLLVYYSLDPARKFQQDEIHKTQPAFYKAGEAVTTGC